MDSMLVGTAQLGKKKGYYVKIMGSAIRFLNVNELGLCEIAETLRMMQRVMMMTLLQVFF